MALVGRELFGYLDSNQSDIVEEIQRMVRTQLSEVKDSWLINGLIDYFVETNSAQALELILDAPRHHDRYFLNYISDGLQKKRRPFILMFILFYGVRRNPPPSWVRKLCKHSAMKELLNCLGAKSDGLTVVAGLMTLCGLVIYASRDIDKNCLQHIFEMFWRVAHWMPQTSDDGSMRDYISATLHSLFVRLYAVYPCNLVQYFRVHCTGTYDKIFFQNTIKPMIDQVRLHPFLFTFTKELEVDQGFIIKDDRSAVTQWALVALDPLESTCEEPPVLVDPEVCKASFTDFKCWAHRTQEDFFWSPSHSASSNFAQVERPHSVPTTPLPNPLSNPVYPKGAKESPPEAAVEATPDPTPNSTPHLSDAHRQKLAGAIGTTNNPRKQIIGENENLIDSVPPSSTLFRLLNTIQTRREGGAAGPSAANVASNAPPEASGVSRRDISLSPTEAHDRNSIWSPPQHSYASSFNNGFSSTTVSPLPSDQLIEKDSDEQQPNILPTVQEEPSVRSRKKSVFVQPSLDMLQFSDAQATAQQTSEGGGEKSEVEEGPSGTLVDDQNDTRKESLETNSSELEEEESQGLGPPSNSSMIELVEKANLPRLRFLSQCGPPLDSAQLDSITPAERKGNITMDQSVMTRSRSFSSLQGLETADLDLSSSSKLMPNYSQVKLDASTQTQASAAIDPFDKLIETFVTNRPPKIASENDDGLMGSTSPHILLENYIKRKVIDCAEPLPTFRTKNLKTAEDMINSQLYAMYALMVLERQKRRIHATRNRRILAVAKRVQEVVEANKSLETKLEKQLDEYRNVSENNKFMASCYQKMKRAMDRDLKEKKLVMKNYDPKTKTLDLDATVITNLTRTVKTSQTDEEKDKVVVILHRPSDVEKDVEKDSMYRLMGAVTKNLDDSRALNRENSVKIAQFQEKISKTASEEEAINTLKNEKEMTRQNIAVMKIQLTMKDELLLETMNRVEGLEEELRTAKCNLENANETLNEYEKKLVKNKSTLSPVDTVALIRISGDVMKREADTLKEMEAMKKRMKINEEKVAQFEQESIRLRKLNAEMEEKLLRVTADKAVLERKSDAFPGQNGFSRMDLINQNPNTFINRAAASSTRPIGFHSTAPGGNSNAGGASRK